MRMPKPERIALLTPEQRVVYENWLKEDKLFSVCLDELLSVIETGNQQAIDQAQEKLEATIPPICEHGRDTTRCCAECNEIECILYPEFCDRDGNMLSEEEIFDIVNKEMNNELN